MKLKYFVVLLGVVGISSCKWGVPHNTPPSIIKDTLAYSYQTIKERQADCGNKPDSQCTIVQIKYPVFKTHKFLNDSVQKFIINHFQTNNQLSTSVEQSAKNYANEYNKLIKKPDHGLQSPDYVRLNVDVVRQDSNLVAIQMDDDGYPAGTSQKGKKTFAYFSNWDIKKNKKILLKDILIENYYTKLNQVAEPIFRTEEKLSATASLKPDYFFKDGKFTLPDNFIITPLGLRFLYNPFDIKPLAAGTTDLFIPYSQIKSLLQPHTVVSQYIK